MSARSWSRPATKPRPWCAATCGADRCSATMPLRRLGCRSPCRSTRLTEPLTTARPVPVQRPPPRGEVLWNALESVHAQLQLQQPTETYTIGELESVVTPLRAQLEEPARRGRVRVRPGGRAAIV